MSSPIRLNWRTPIALATLGMGVIMWCETLGRNMRHIIYVDGSVGVGKSTFIEILYQTFASVLGIVGNNNSSHNFNVEVLPEPLHRNWTNRIINELGYENLLHFLLVRKIVAIEDWSKRIASDGLQELERNVLIVERSLFGDRRVNADCEKLFDNKNVTYSGESVHYIFIKNLEKENAEQERLNVLYKRPQAEFDNAVRRLDRMQPV